MIPASALGAWNFCPRTVYFQRVLGIKTPQKEVMLKGTIKHKLFEGMIASYKKKGKIQTINLIENILSEYQKELEGFGTDIKDFKRDLEWSFKILEKNILDKEFAIPEFCEEWLESKDLDLKARVDVIYDESGEWIVGDIKSSISDFPGTRMQIGAGALLFEKHKGVTVNKLKIISHYNWVDKEIHLTDELRRQILTTRDEINDMIKTKKCPQGCNNPNKCCLCDFKEKCGDLDGKKSLLRRVFG